METETKVGIPFIRREYIFDYPEVSVNQIHMNVLCYAVANECPIKCILYF